jgi:RimJ/RimL family protein N-acetyltransferase
LQVIVGNMPWRFSSYMAYCDNGAADDEMPLYLFDKVRGWRQQQQQQHWQWQQQQQQHWQWQQQQRGSRSGSRSAVC